MSLGSTAVIEFQSPSSFVTDGAQDFVLMVKFFFQKRGIEFTYFKKHRCQFFNLETFRTGLVY